MHFLIKKVINKQDDLGIKKKSRYNQKLAKPKKTKLDVIDINMTVTITLIIHNYFTAFNRKIQMNFHVIFGTWLRILKL